ncbi:SEC14-like protein 2 isoform X1 [Centruroides sculpturatus]|uniref:SEC14-like protein 2 isoform X1 n=2 Tax=Centruroides sculpturatus TaxID=218467 RepID=UPI000C6D3760|nr:SEC14-like protein 2 isoform X1 [Centruroides sculpturatus]
MEELTSKQLLILKEFRNAVADVLLPKHDDNFLVRWLIARKFNIEDAESMLRKSLLWRKQFNLDNIINYTPPEIFSYYWKFNTSSHDKDGNPVLFIRYGCYDMRGMFQAAKISEIKKFFAKSMEIIIRDCEEQTKKLGRYVGKLFVLIDMDQFSLHQFLYKPAFDVLSQSLVMMDNNYPELLRKVMIINAPAPFSMAYNLIKPFLHERTIQKIQIFGRSGWQQMLFTFISPNEVPAIWGGKKVDPDGDPACPSMVSPGGPVPKSFYLSSNKVFMDENAETLIVSQKSHISVEVPVTKNDSILSWEFQTEKHDIGFAVSFKNSDNNNCKLEEIIPLERVESSLIPEQGELICIKTGTYILKFDNSHSMFRSKRVKYKYEVKSSTK